MNEPIYELHLPRSAALQALAMLAKLPIEQGLAAFQALQQQVVEAEERQRVAEARQIMRSIEQ